MATSYQMSKGSSKSHKSLEPKGDMVQNYIDVKKRKRIEKAIKKKTGKSLDELARNYWTPPK